jgi:hypothetical protein
MSFVAGMLVGMLVVAVAVEIIVWGRQQEARHWQATPIKVEYVHDIELPQDRPAIRQAEIERRKERFAEVAPEINMGAIVQIESSGNPRAVSPAGCRGLCQIAEGTWVECCKWLGVSWTWSEDAFDPGCNRAVGNYYINHRIPAMLAHYGIDDSVTTRIGAYNAGIGTLLRLWRKHGHEWLAHAPKETQRYVLRYAEIMARQQTQ